MPRGRPNRSTLATILAAHTLTRGEALVVTHTHLKLRLEGFEKPDALLAYWYQPTVKQRVESLPRHWQEEIHRLFWLRLESLNMAGPF